MVVARRRTTWHTVTLIMELCVLPQFRVSPKDWVFMAEMTIYLVRQRRWRRKGTNEKSVGGSKMSKGRQIERGGRDTRRERGGKRE